MTDNAFQEKLLNELIKSREAAEAKDKEINALTEKVIELSKRIEDISNNQSMVTEDKVRSLSQIKDMLSGTNEVKASPETETLVRKAVDYIMYYGQKQSHLS